MPVLEQVARAAWERGDVVPHRITLALDLGQHYGPGVDRACGVEEPAVDQWEAGILYPTFEQLLALAELTAFPIGFFLMPEDGEIHALGPGIAFVCFRSHPSWNPRVEIPAPILAFTPAAVDAAVRGHCGACVHTGPGPRPAHTCQQTALF